MNNTGDSAALPKSLLMAIALIQGLFLLALERTVDAHLWPWQQPVYLYPLLALGIITPTLCLMSFTRDNIVAPLKWITIYSLLVFLVAAYTGWNLQPAEKITAYTINYLLVITLGVASFKALMYLQQSSSGLPLSYGLLFRLSWRNFLVLSLSGLFTLIFWGILVLCGALFKVIKINLIAEIVAKHWFLFPALALANGTGVIMFRNMASVVDTIASLLKTLMKFLLPLLVAIAILFLLALPFTGLQTLWGTGNGCLLILWLQLLLLFFTNAVYQDESQESPYPLYIHRFIYAGIALLPVYSAIALIGLRARVEQYGLSVDRCWALLIWLLLGMFALGYLWGIVKKRDQWIETLSRVNILMGLVLLAALLAVNSPLLDFRKLAVNAQLEQLANKKISLEKLDLYYFKRELGRPGYLALLDLQKRYADNTDFDARVKSVFEEYENKVKPTMQNFAAAINKNPQDLLIPPELLQQLYVEETDNNWHWKHVRSMYLISRDLNGDGKPDYVFVTLTDTWCDATLWYQDGNQWKKKAMNPTQDCGRSFESEFNKDDIGVVDPTWKTLRVGQKRIGVADFDNK